MSTINHQPHACDGSVVEPQRWLYRRAALVTALWGALVMQSAYSQNECGPGPSVSCSGSFSGTGITYESAVDFDFTSVGNINAGNNGVSITALADAGISLEPGGNITGNGGVSLFSVAGDIEALLTSVNLTGGLNITSESGDIFVQRIRNDATDMQLVGGGNITVLMPDDWGEGLLENSQSRRSRLTVDASSGDGLIHIINRNDTVNGYRSILDEGLDATVGSGGLILDIEGSGPDLMSPTLAERRTSNGEVGVSGGISLKGVGAATINLRRDAFFFTNSGSDGAVTLDEEYAYMRGTLDASELAGGLVVSVGAGGAWQIDDTVVLSASSDMVEVLSGGFLHMPVTSPGNGESELQAIDFGAGDDRLVLEHGAHLLVAPLLVPGNRDVPGQIGDSRSTYEGEFLIEGLEVLELKGEIWLGTSLPRGAIVAGYLPEQGLRHQGSDQSPDDILYLPGATLVGHPEGRIHLDFDLNAIEALQDRCASSLRAPVTNSLPVGDCIRMEDGRIEGSVLISATPTASGGRGAFNPDGNVIVDLSSADFSPGAGGLAEGAVVEFAPESRFYNPAFGGILDNGMFAYHLLYDADATQVKVIGVPSAGAYHQPIIANAAQSAWRTATGGFFDRQADLRDTLRGGVIDDHGVWLKTTFDDGQRDVRHTFAVASGDITYDNSHSQETSAVTAGVDVISGGDTEASWLLGGMLGYVRTDIAYTRLWTDTAYMNGMMAGAYGSYVAGPLFVDATVAGNWTRLVQDMPQAELANDRNLSSDSETLGARVEAGWRFDLGAARLEPLATAAWSRTTMDDFKVPEADPNEPGNQIMFEDTTSTRLGLGLRGSTEFAVFGDMKLGLSLTGRFMNEADGEAKAAIGNVNPISPEVVDTWDGTFSELTGGVTVANSTGRVSGVLNIGTRSGDDYSATSASASFRYQW